MEDYDDIEYLSYEEAIDEYLLAEEPDQFELLHELMDGIETMDSDEYEDKRDMLTNEHALNVLSEYESDFCDNAIGDDSWKCGR